MIRLKVAKRSPNAALSRLRNVTHTATEVEPLCDTISLQLRSVEVVAGSNHGCGVIMVEIWYNSMVNYSFPPLDALPATINFKLSQVLAPNSLQNEMHPNLYD